MTKDRDLADAARSFRRLYFLPIALAASAGKEGDLAEACDIAEQAIVSALRLAREEEREAATLAEQEACAKIADERKLCREDQPETHDGMWATYGYTGQRIAARIRSRSSEKSNG